MFTFLQIPVAEISGTVVLLQICPVLGNQNLWEPKINCKPKSWHIWAISYKHVYVCQNKIYSFCACVIIVSWFLFNRNGSTFPTEDPTNTTYKNYIHILLLIWNILCFSFILCCICCTCHACYRSRQTNGKNMFPR